MLNSELKLNKNYFAEGGQQKSTRQGFGEGLVMAAKTDERVVGLCADVTESLYMADFRAKFPRRFVEMGVAEQNMAAVASGLSAMGKIPFMASYAVFSPGRNWEQIRTTICYNNRPVKIIGSHGGVSVGPDGGSHQGLEDIALMKVLPRMNIISPCDAEEAKKAVIASLYIDGPVYIRLARPSVPILYTNDSPFSFGRAAKIWFSENNKSDVGIISTGIMIHEVLKAVRILEKKGVGANVINLSTIKPIDREAIVSLARKSGAIVTVEEHQIFGGMGEAVAGVLAVECPVPQEFVGIKDRFGQSGTPEELFKEYKLDALSILEAVERVVKRKGKLCN